MYHTIKFRYHFTLSLEISSNKPLQQLVIAKGTRLKTQLKPYVSECSGGPVEVADLYFEDGTVTRGVPFCLFTFVD